MRKEFFKLKIIKKYYLLNYKQKRLTNLAILSTEREYMAEINSDKVTDKSG